MRKQKAFLVASLVLFVLGIGALACDEGGTGGAEKVEKPSEAPLATATPVASPTATPQSPLPSTPLTYVVQRGDTLAGIAGHYDTTAEAICAFNELEDCSLIRPGQELLIPSEVVPMSTPIPETPTPTLMPIPPTPTGEAAMPAWLCCSDCAEIGMPINLWSWNGHERVQVVDKLPHGTQVLVLESEQGDDGRLYYHVVREEHEGWVSEPFVCWSRPE